MSSEEPTTNDTEMVNVGNDAPVSDGAQVVTDNLFMRKLKKFLAQGQEDLNAPYSWLPYCASAMHLRQYWFGAGLPLVLIWAFYWPYMAITNKWWVYAIGWPLSIVMIFGALIAGASSEGGGSVAFPVMTLVLQIRPAVARDFSLMIQSFGMTAAAFSILYTRIVIEHRTLIWSNLGGFTGVCLGLAFVAPNIPPAFTKIVFVSIWLSFAVSLFFLNRISHRMVFFRIPEMNWWKAVLLVVFGFIGGIITSIAGSGIDICTFSVLTLLFRVSEKTATPTSVAQIMAPLGAFLMSFCHRLVAALMVYITDTVQFVLAWIVIPMTIPLVITSLACVIVFGSIWAVLTLGGRLLLSTFEGKDIPELDTGNHEDYGKVKETAV